MKKVIVYYAHPGQRYSHANQAMRHSAARVQDITYVDLYADYPRYNIDIEKEQQRLLDHDIIVFQCPLFWYSTPSLVKEWIDLTLEHGFAYGEGGHHLADKTMMFALTAAGPSEAYTDKGYQHYPLRTFLTPLEQTARLCKMRFAAPYVLYGSLKAIEDGSIPPHAEGYAKLLSALRDDTYNFDAADKLGTVEAKHLPSLMGGKSHG